MGLHFAKKPRIVPDSEKICDTTKQGHAGRSPWFAVGTNSVTAANGKLQTFTGKACLYS
jgi:hypothetical protein